MDDVIPILHGERTFAHHHNSHGDVVVGAIDIRVPKSITQVESMATTALHYVLTDLRRTFHVQDTGFPLILFNQLSQYLLTIAFTPYLFAHGKVPKPVKLLTWIDDGEAYEVFAIVVISVPLKSGPVKY